MHYGIGMDYGILPKCQNPLFHSNTQLIWNDLSPPKSSFHLAYCPSHWHTLLSILSSTVRLFNQPTAVTTGLWVVQSPTLLVSHLHVHSAISLHCCSLEWDWSYAYPGKAFRQPPRSFRGPKSSGIPVQRLTRQLRNNIMHARGVCE